MFGKVINIKAECYVSPSSFRFFPIGKISEKTSITFSGDLSKMRCCVSYLKLFPVFEDARTQLLT